jgi:hypothetical protein
LWQAGEFDKLVKEARDIQANCRTMRRARTPEQVTKIFSKLMLEGKVNAAMRLFDETDSGGVLSLSEEVIEELVRKHPIPPTCGGINFNQRRSPVCCSSSLCKYR